MTNTELARKIYDTGRNEASTGNWIFHISALDGRTPEECMYILLDEYRDDILDITCTDTELDIIFALEVCPYFEDDEY